MKALEALERIINAFECGLPINTKDIKLIETALKDYEMEHTLRIRLENINYELVRENQENNKKLKALEIIKEKEVNIGNFLDRIRKDTDYKEYQRLCGLYIITVFSEKEITQEEYGILKEVLL